MAPWQRYVPPPVGDYKDLDTLREFARGKDVITFDHEHVPTEFLRTLMSEGVNVQPRPELCSTLRTSPPDVPPPPVRERRGS